MGVDVTFAVAVAAVLVELAVVTALGIAGGVDFAHFDWLSSRNCFCEYAKAENLEGAVYLRLHLHLHLHLLVCHPHLCN